jgi:hypothetical protein
MPWVRPLNFEMARPACVHGPVLNDALRLFTDRCSELHQRLGLAGEAFDLDCEAFLGSKIGGDIQWFFLKGVVQGDVPRRR